MAGVRVRLRLPAERDRNALQDANLHEEMVGRCHDEVRRALDATAGLFAADQEVFLPHVEQIVATNLAAMPNLRRVVEEAVALGGTALDVDGYFVAMATWIIDNQLQDGLYWTPATDLRRRDGVG